MMKKTHIVGGVLAGSIAIKHYGVSDSLMPMALSASAIGSLLPDIDHRNSYIGRRFKFLSWITNKALGHRGPVHSPLFAGLFFAVIQLLINNSSLCVYSGVLTTINTFLFYGMLSHIFLDSLTPAGVPLLYPFSIKKISLFSIKSGGVFENLFRYLLYIILCGVWIVR